MDLDDQQMDWAQLLAPGEDDGRWLRVDQYADTLASLEHTAVVAAQIEEHPTQWKWCVLSAHSALQGAPVCTLSGSAGIGAEEKIKKWREYLERSREENVEPPESRLATLTELLRRAQCDKYMSEFGGKPIYVSNDMRNDIIFLNKIRNQFVHFGALSWSLERTGLPRIVSTAISICCDLLLKHPANTMRSGDEYRLAVGAAVSQTRAAMEHLDLLYAE